MAIRNDTDDNLVADWQGVEIPNELQAPAHEHAALLVRDGKLVTGLSTEPGLFVSKLVSSAGLSQRGSFAGSAGQANCTDLPLRDAGSRWRVQ